MFVASSTAGSIIQIPNPRAARQICVSTRALSLESLLAVSRTMSSENEETTHPRQRLSCTKYFDALWFCYSPVHQMQQYYRVGVFDNCSGKWSALLDCLTLKTKRSAEVEEILKDREKDQHHIWTFRSPSEARRHWDNMFGHLDDKE